MVFNDLVNAITKLNDVGRQVLLLRYAQELTHDEIGARVNLSSDAVRMRHDRPIGKLRSRFAAQNLGAILPLAFQAHPRIAPATTRPSVPADGKP